MVFPSPSSSLCLFGCVTIKLVQIVNFSFTSQTWNIKLSKFFPCLTSALLLDVCRRRRTLKLICLVGPWCTSSWPLMHLQRYLYILPLLSLNQLDHIQRFHYLKEDVLNQFCISWSIIGRLGFLFLSTSLVPILHANSTSLCHTTTKTSSISRLLAFNIFFMNRKSGPWF